MNDDFEDLQKLIALKRFEQPPEGFVEDFMREFHFRQREAASKPSPLGLFWEKVGGFFDSLSGPAWGAVGAAAALVVASISSLSESNSTSLPSSQGMKAVDYKKTKDEAAFKATPFIFGIEEDQEEETKPKDAPADKKTAVKAGEVKPPETLAAPK